MEIRAEINITSELIITKDEETAHLMRESTRLKGLGDMDGALACLAAAKPRLLASRGHPVETLCKYGRYLKDAGRFDEAIAEFNSLIDDLPRRADHEYHVDDPSVSYGKTGPTKKQRAAAMRRHQKKYIEWELERVYKKAGRDMPKPAPKPKD